jgi:putative ABC transport system substrate-binding protein
MQRREFFALLGGLWAAMPPAARAQQTGLPVVGYLSSKSESAEAGIIAAVRQGLKDSGFVEGKNVDFVYRWAEGDYARLPDFAAELVNAKVDTIVASGLPATLAAKAATSTIPIVFRLAIDPVAFGLAQSFDRPGGNTTGVTMLFDPLTPKKLQLLHELFPAETKIGFLINPNNQNAASHRDHAAAAAAAMNLHLIVLTLGRGEELESALTTARNGGVGAVLVGDDPLFDVLSHELVDAATRHKIPTMYYVRDFVMAGGLISYGPSFDEMAKQVGAYLARILKGERVADLPIQQPTKIELVVNLKTAKALGIAIPRTLLTAADEVVE